MADGNSVMRLTTGNEIIVRMSLEALYTRLAECLASSVPFMQVEDTNGQSHLIHVYEIVEIEGPG